MQNKAQLHGCSTEPWLNFDQTLMNLGALKMLEGVFCFFMPVVIGLCSVLS